MLDLTKMWGYAVTPPASAGSFDWDDVQVYGVAGAPADQSVALSKPVVLAHEGDTVDVPVVLTTRDGQPSKAPVDVGYTTSGGTATPIDDYESTSGTLSVPGRDGLGHGQDVLGARADRRRGGDAPRRSASSSRRPAPTCRTTPATW